VPRKQRELKREIASENLIDPAAEKETIMNRYLPSKSQIVAGLREFAARC